MAATTDSEWSPTILVFALKEYEINKLIYNRITCRLDLLLLCVPGGYNSLCHNSLWSTRWADSFYIFNLKDIEYRLS